MAGGWDNFRDADAPAATTADVLARMDGQPAADAWSAFKDVEGAPSRPAPQRIDFDAPRSFAQPRLAESAEATAVQPDVSPAERVMTLARNLGRGGIQDRLAAAAAASGQPLYQGHIDTEAAQRQHAAPLVRDMKGAFVRKPLGEIEEYDFGPLVRAPDGKVFAFNRASDVMLRDPDTGKLMAFARDQDIDNPGLITRTAQALLPGMVSNAPTRVASSNAVPMAVERGRALGFPTSPATRQVGERAADAAAYATLETELFAPAFRSKGAARFARTIEEMPVLGGIVKNPKTKTELALRDAQARIASDLGASQTDEAAGRVLQGGLDRFRTARLQQLPARDVAATGIDPFSPVQASAATSRGAAARAEAAAEIAPQVGADVAHTTRGAEVAPARPMSEVYRGRSRVDDLSDAQLDQLARTPAQQTSFATRADALYEKARRNLPPLFKRDGSANPNEIATPNSQLVARGLLQQEQSARISGGVLDGRFGPLIKALSNPQAPFTVESLLASRREVGRALASFGEYDARLDRSQLKEIYGAITRDLEVGIRDVANRAALGTRQHNQKGLQYFGPPNVTKGPNGEAVKTPTQVSPDVARRAAQALRDFRVADRYYRGAISQMDRFTQLLDAKSPEAAMRSLATRMKEGTLDRGLVRVVSEALHPEERNQVLGYLITRMGQRPGAKEAEQVWNLHTFATDWNKNKDALALMARGAPAGVVSRLNALARVSGRMKYYETTKNYSGTAYSGIPIVTALSTAVTGGVGGFLMLLGQVAGMAAMGKFLTSPRYLDWMVQAASTRVVPRAAGPQVGGTKAPAILESLRMLAANDNELGPAIAQTLDFLGKRGVAEPPDRAGDNRQQ